MNFQESKRSESISPALYNSPFLTEPGHAPGFFVYYSAWPRAGFLFVETDVTHFRFSQRSEENLIGVMPELVSLARRALELSGVDFGVTEGLRRHERQRQLVAEKKS